MAYSLMGGGKRLRPALVYATADILGHGEGLEPLDPWAAAIECIHTYSLIHDDLPAMDDDSLRRGQPTCHKQFDEATAILAGDGLLTLAFEILADPQWALPVDRRMESIHLLSLAAGRRGMVGGQMLDLTHEGKSRDALALSQLHLAKTGAMLKVCCTGTACLLGASSDVRATLDQFGAHLGLGFQIADDILDETQSSQTLGKTAGKDRAADKLTYVKQWGLAGAKEKAQETLQLALRALDQLGARDSYLETLARMLIDRKS